MKKNERAMSYQSGVSHLAEGDRMDHIFHNHISLTRKVDNLRRKAEPFKASPVNIQLDRINLLECSSGFEGASEKSWTGPLTPPEAEEITSVLVKGGIPEPTPPSSSEFEETIRR